MDLHNFMVDKLKPKSIKTLILWLTATSKSFQTLF